jgi:hypothetical protein
VVALVLLVLVPGAGAGEMPDAVAWVDAPLDGSTVPAAPLEIVAHATDPGGVTTVAVSVDGALIATVPFDGRTSLVTARVAWTDVTPGIHLVTAQGRGSSGALGLPAGAVVVVAAEGGATPSPAAPTATPSSQPTPSPGPGATSGPTATPRSTPKPTPRPTPKPTRTPRPTPVCSPPPPNLVFPVNGRIIGPDDQNPPTFTWRAGSPDCEVTGFHLHVWNHVLGYEKDVDLSDNSWTPNNPLDIDPSDPWECAHYQWEVWSYGPDGEAGELSTDTFRVSPTGQCGP